MNAFALPPGHDLAEYPGDLDPVAAEVLRLLRLWRATGTCREAVCLAAPMQFGAARAQAVLQSLSGFSDLLDLRSARPLAFRCPDSGRLGMDEAQVARLVTFATAGAFDEAEMIARRLLPGEAAGKAAALAHGLGQMLSTGDWAPASGCPFACPTRLVANLCPKAGA